MFEWLKDNIINMKREIFFTRIQQKHYRIHFNIGSLNHIWEKYIKICLFRAILHMMLGQHLPLKN